MFNNSTTFLLAAPGLVRYLAVLECHCLELPLQAVSSSTQRPLLFLGTDYLKVLLGYSLLKAVQLLVTRTQLVPQPPGPPLQSLRERERSGYYVNLV